MLLPLNALSDMVLSCLIHKTYICVYIERSIGKNHHFSFNIFICIPCYMFNWNFYVNKPFRFLSNECNLGAFCGEKWGLNGGMIILDQFFMNLYSFV